MPHDCGHVCCDERGDPMHDHFLSPDACPSCATRRAAAVDALEGGPGEPEVRDGAGPYSIGSDVFPGLSKLVEECGEVVQVAGKILGSAGWAHWDGDLRARLEDEIGDAMAAFAYFGACNGLSQPRIFERAEAKRALFERWHDEARRSR